jgi:arginyl-tRNA synthetase
MISTLLINEIKEQVNLMLYENGVEKGNHPNIYVEHPSHYDHGDYSTNIAMLLAKILKKHPIQIASDLQLNFEKRGTFDGLFYKIVVAPPGFINFYVNWHVWATRSFEAPKGSKSKVIIEHTSILMI